jgi:hypothetical protein
MELGSFLQREPWRIKKRFSQVTSARDYRGGTFPFHMRAHLVNTRSVGTQIKKTPSLFGSSRQSQGTEVESLTHFITNLKIEIMTLKAIPKLLAWLALLGNL